MYTIEFTNPQTAAAYEPLTSHNQFVDIPARKGNGTCYRGMLADITPEAAERYVRFGGNLIKEKEPLVILSDSEEAETDEG